MSVDAQTNSLMRFARYTFLGWITFSTRQFPSAKFVIFARVSNYTRNRRVNGDRPSRTRESLSIFTSQTLLSIILLNVRQHWCCCAASGEENAQETAPSLRVYYEFLPWFKQERHDKNFDNFYSVFTPFATFYIIIFSFSVDFAQKNSCVSK